MPATSSTPIEPKGQAPGTVSIIFGALSILLAIVPFVGLVLSAVGLVISAIQFRQYGTTREGYKVVTTAGWKNIAVRARVGFILSIIGLLLSPLGLFTGILAFIFNS
jgi:hypothetical protein